MSGLVWASAGACLFLLFLKNPGQIRTMNALCTTTPGLTMLPLGTNWPLGRRPPRNASTSRGADQIMKTKSPARKTLFSASSLSKPFSSSSSPKATPTAAPSSWRVS